MIYILAEKAWQEDELVRLAKIKLFQEGCREWFEAKLRKTLECDERSIPDPIDRKPRPDTFHLPFQLSWASAWTMGKDMVMQLAP